MWSWVLQDGPERLYRRARSWYMQRLLSLDVLVFLGVLSVLSHFFPWLLSPGAVINESQPVHLVAVASLRSVLVAVASCIWLCELFRSDASAVAAGESRSLWIECLLLAQGVALVYTLLYVVIGRPYDEEWGGDVWASVMASPHSFINYAVFCPLLGVVLIHSTRRAVARTRALRKRTRWLSREADLDRELAMLRGGAVELMHNHIQVLLILMAAIGYQLLVFKLYEKLSIRPTLTGLPLFVAWVGHVGVALPSAYAFLCVLTGYIQNFERIMSIGRVQGRRVEWLANARGYAGPVSVILDSAARHPLSLAFLAVPVVLNVTGALLI